MTDQIVRKMGEKKLADLKMETKFTHFKADFAHMLSSHTVCNVSKQIVNLVEDTVGQLCKGVRWFRIHLTGPVISVVLAPCAHEQPWLRHTTIQSILERVMTVLFGEDVAH